VITEKGVAGREAKEEEDGSPVGGSMGSSGNNIPSINTTVSEGGTCVVRGGIWGRGVSLGKVIIEDQQTERVKEKRAPKGDYKDLLPGCPERKVESS